MFFAKNIFQKNIHRHQLTPLWHFNLNLKLEIMKTQINKLVNGSTHLCNGISGTKKEDRSAIAKKVRLENPEKMIVVINDETIELTANWSLSGKSVTYSGEVSISNYKSFFGTFGLPKKEPKAYLNISGEMVAELTTNSKKIFYNTISNENILIL